jgi:hypothetical protein
MSTLAAWLEESHLPWPVGQERRAAVRRPSVRQVTCRVLGRDDRALRLGRLRDVSTFGVGLLLPDPVTPGALLEIDFAGLEQNPGRALLGRVVHLAPQPGGWLAGCALVKEVGDDALRLFQAAPVRAPAGDSRRWVRFPCAVEAVCSSLDTSPGERSPARVVNASAGGVGLLLTCEFGVGTLLNLAEVGGRAVAPVLLRVVRSVPQGSAGWLLGCEFADWLLDEELTLLCPATESGST